MQILATLIVAKVLLTLGILYPRHAASRKAKTCRWRRTGGGDGEAGSKNAKWRCETCEAEAATSDEYVAFGTVISLLLLVNSDN